MTVAALYVDPVAGPYPDLIGLEQCWGLERDAKTYPGPGAVIAHPPCGPWGSFRWNCSKQDPGAGPFAVTQVRRFGGVLEHPAFSTLWKECDLPLPLGPPFLFCPAEFTIQVDQCRWGHPCRKRTWLFFSGIDPAKIPAVPAWQRPTHCIGGSRDTREKRKAGLLPPLPQLGGGAGSTSHLTPPAFAAWLLAAVSA